MLRGLWEAPIDGGAPHALFTAEYGLDSFAPSPDGSQIAVAVRTATPTVDIWLIEADGSNPRKVVDCAPDGCGGLAWSPDGRLLAYELRERGGLPSRVWLYDLDTGETAPVFQDRQVLGYAPTWSPDGSRLAFYDASVEGIRVLDLDSGAVAVIPSLMGEVGSFAPDGAQMVYADIRRVGRQFVPELWLADLSADGGLAPLLEDGQDDQGSAWSPDGGLIALGRHNLEEGAAGVATGRQLVLYDVASGALRPVTNDPAYNNTRFVWDPTGGWLLIQRYRLTEQFASPEIWVYDVAGGVLRQIAESGIDGGWLP
ncbi:MAG: hypothetical protein M5R40_04115 [Anaerolineae bacterium]|nr:hypothetical protein [Anaerolineae bacterium]